jgi:hypothetical protein
LTAKVRAKQQWLPHAMSLCLGKDIKGEALG